MDAPRHLPARVPVLIAGGGPVGLTTAGLLAAYGIDCLVVEADAGYCTGSRAICLSRRSLEILGWTGADAAVQQRGLGWTSGRSYFRDREILRFDMPHDAGQRFAPMTNLQQYHVEQFLHEAAARQPGKVTVLWSSEVRDVIAHAQGAHAQGAQVQVRTPQGAHAVHADWLIACDGGRSTVRERLGLTLEGMQYEGRYVIVDIEQASSRPVERLAWFDPPSNPGATLLMHRQPDDVWRIDYQIRDDEDAQAAVLPENVLPRVQAHLDMIGETAPWRPLWISLYNAKCLSLASYRHGRVLFAGDAGHLVPIFGVRGLNSGLDDAGNLAWKLAWVLRGAAPESLLDTFSVERVHATRQNLAYGAKSTEFMAPPSAGFALMRDAALRLALVEPGVRSLINPRQSAPIAYAGSALNGDDGLPGADPRWAPGAPAPEVALGAGRAFTHLSQCFGRGFVVLAVGVSMPAQQALARECDEHAAGAALPAPILVVIDATEAAAMDALTGAVLLLRPDGYVLGRWPADKPEGLAAALTHWYGAQSSSTGATP